MYRFSQTARFNFKYTTSSSQPTVNQLQPIPDNSNPNSVIIGNTNLLPTFSHNFNMSANTYKPISGKYIWTNANYSITDNAFANSIVYDSLGRTISQSVNVDGNYNASAYVGGGIPLFSRVLTIQPSANANYNSYTSYINLQKNITKTLNVGMNLGIDFDIDTLAFSLAYGYDYNAPSSSLSAAANKPYADQTFTGSFRLKLPFKILLESDAAYTIKGQRAEGYNTNYVVWNASISKSFFKLENLILTVSGNDILNQNISNNRTVQDNMIIDSKTNIISRYFLLKLTYKFNSTKTKDNENDMW